MKVNLNFKFYLIRTNLGLRTLTSFEGLQETIGWSFLMKKKTPNLCNKTFT
jgi:hypothetical protein